MRFKYWTVRMRPTPMSISTIGVGVIVEDTQSGIINYQFVEDIKALLPHFPHQKAVKRRIEDNRVWFPAVRLEQPPRIDDGQIPRLPG